MCRLKTGSSPPCGTPQLQWEPKRDVSLEEMKVELRKNTYGRGRKKKVLRYLGEECMKAARLVIREDFTWNHGL